jgi:uncharacterized protein (DUF1697 family)
MRGRGVAVRDGGHLVTALACEALAVRGPLLLGRMSVRVGFLRAVNLGGRRVPMTRLVAVCDNLGYAKAWTYVNSGNVVFDTTGTRASVERAMQQALEDEFGFECTTFVRTAKQLRTILDTRPFTPPAGDTHFVTLLKKAPSTSDAKRLEALSNDFDTLVVHGSEVHWRMRGRSTDSHLTKRDWEKVLGPVSSTSRNITMLTKLVAKLDAA